MRNDTEFRKIRQYVISLIGADGGKPQAIPASRQLAAQLNVAHTTVLRAMRHLAEDGFVELLPQGGARTLPADKDISLTRLAGIIRGDGKVAFDNYFYARLASAVSLEYTRRACGHGTRDIYVEYGSALPAIVKRDSLAGLILVGRKPTAGIISAVRKLHNDRQFPVAVLYESVEGISSYDITDVRIFEEMCRKLLQEGRRRMVAIIPQNNCAEERKQTAKRLCAEHGVADSCIAVIADRPAAAVERLREMLAFGMRFDGLVFLHQLGGVYPDLREITAQMDNCRIACYEYAIRKDLRYTGYALDFRLDTAAEWLVDDLLAQAENPQRPAEFREIPTVWREYAEGELISTTEK